MATTVTRNINEQFTRHIYEPISQRTLNEITQCAHQYYNTCAIDNTYATGYATATNVTINNDATTATNLYVVSSATASSQYIWTIDDPAYNYITAVDYGYIGNTFTPEELKRITVKEQFKRNLAPNILIKRFSLGRAGKPSEDRAREALLQIVGPDRFRRYVKNGFLSIKGRSGKIYQIFPGHQMTKVWVDGEHVEDLCVVMVDSSLPPSDSVIMRMLMILDSEEAFRKIANVFPRNRLTSNIYIAA